MVKTITLMRTLELPLLRISTNKLQQLIMVSVKKKRGQIARTTELKTSPVNDVVNTGAIMAVWKTMIPQHNPGKKLFIRVNSLSTSKFN